MEIKNLTSKIELCMGIFIVICAFLLSRKDVFPVNSLPASVCITIDAGHGGSDPGKIGINHAKEKDINLVIAKKLKEVLAANGVKVIMTRESDHGLYSDDTINKKVEDMQKRCQIISDSDSLFTISIHQNSYPTSDIRGAQVFYYGQSEKGKLLAEALQHSLVTLVDPDNHRQAKANESYYLLKKTPTPTVIVECGFLSNPEEADLLLQDEYQDKIVAAIYSGIQTYLRQEMLESLSTESDQNLNTATP